MSIEPFGRKPEITFLVWQMLGSKLQNLINPHLSNVKLEKNALNS